MTIVESATRRPHDSTARLKSSRSSARAITSTPAPISSIPSSSRIPAAVELEREVERRLAAHRRQQRVGPLAAEHAGDALEVERLEVGRVGEPGVGHDRRRVRVDDDRPVALLAQHLQRLAAGVVELACLPDHDRPRADQADRLDVVTPRQGDYLLEPFADDRPRVVRARPGLRVELHRARAELRVGEPLDGAVVERLVRRRPPVAGARPRSRGSGSSRAPGRSRARPRGGSRRGGRTAA